MHFYLSTNIDKFLVLLTQNKNLKYLYGYAFPVSKIQNDATAIMAFVECIAYNIINRTWHASQRCGACRGVYKNVTDFVTDNVTNKRTVTFRVIEKMTDKYGAEKI